MTVLSLSKKQDTTFCTMQYTDSGWLWFQRSHYFYLTGNVVDTVFSVPFKNVSTIQYLFFHDTAYTLDAMGNLQLVFDEKLYFAREHDTAYSLFGTGGQRSITCNTVTAHVGSDSASGIEKKTLSIFSAPLVGNGNDTDIVLWSDQFGMTRLYVNSATQTGVGSNNAYVTKRSWTLISFHSGTAGIVQKTGIGSHGVHACPGRSVKAFLGNSQLTNASARAVAVNGRFLSSHFGKQMVVSQGKK
jgi:hypothetical protein